MDDLKKLKNDYECLKKNFDASLRENQRLEHELFDVKQERDRLWKVVENLSLALRGCVRP